MDSYIFVRSNEEEVKVACTNGSVNRKSLRNAFLLTDDTPISLVKDDVVLQCDENDYFHLGGNWKAEKFDLKWKQEQINQEGQRVISKNKRKLLEEKTAAGEDMDSLIPNKRIKTEEKYTETKDLEWVNSIKHFILYHEDPDGKKRCITPISKTIAVTYAHGSHQGLKLGDDLKIRNYYDENYLVCAKVVKRGDDIDVVVLQAYSNEFTSTDVLVDNPQLGIRYMMMGLSNSKNQKDCLCVKPGSIVCKLNKKGRYVGSSGSAYGDSGAGLWNVNGRLLGMNLSVEHNDVHYDKILQQNYTHAIGGRSMFIGAEYIYFFAEEFIPEPEPISFEE